MGFMRLEGKERLVPLAVLERLEEGVRGCVWKARRGPCQEVCWEGKERVVSGVCWEGRVGNEEGHGSGPLTQSPAFTPPVIPFRCVIIKFVLIFPRRAVKGRRGGRNGRKKRKGWERKERVKGKRV